MKKIYFLFFSLVIGISSHAQTIPGGDMENWRNSTSGITAPIPIHAPVYWYGADSLVIAEGQLIGLALSIPPTSWHSQIYMENTIVHAGSHSAKLVTVYQDTLGYFPGILSNAQAHITVTSTGISPLTYTGGTAVTEKPATVSAWVEYFPGKDTLGVTGADTGVLTVQAVSVIGSVDSVIGTGTVVIPPCSSWTQVTANVTYPLDTSDYVSILRITFSSSGGGNNPTLDSSILYVDDVTMTGVPQIYHEGVKNVTNNSGLVKVYPNPATETIYLDGPQNAGLNCQLFTACGQEALSKALSGNDALDVSALSAGLYFYGITDKTGNTVQRGKISVVR